MSTKIEDRLLSELMKTFASVMGMNKIGDEGAAVYVNGESMGELAIAAVTAAAKMVGAIHAGAEMEHLQTETEAQESRLVACSAFSKLFINEFVKDLETHAELRKSLFDNMRTKQ